MLAFLHAEPCGNEDSTLLDRAQRKKQGVCNDIGRDPTDLDLKVEGLLYENETSEPFESDQ